MLKLLLCHKVLYMSFVHTSPFKALLLLLMQRDFFHVAIGLHKNMAFVLVLFFKSLLLSLMQIDFLHVAIVCGLKKTQIGGWLVFRLFFI